MAHDPNDPNFRLTPKHELPWPEETDPAKVGEQFADPNSADDRRVGRNFEESNFSGKKHHTPLNERIAGNTQVEAALNAGFTRLRPVMMTAIAMIIGMLPMSLALGEGGEQNAPLGRAVIGGLLLATVGTLFIVPVIYSLLKNDLPVDYDKEIDEEYGPKDQDQQQEQTA